MHYMTTTIIYFELVVHREQLYFWCLLCDFVIVSHKSLNRPSTADATHQSNNRFDANGSRLESSIKFTDTNNI